MSDVISTGLGPDQVDTGFSDLFKSEQAPGMTLFEYMNQPSVQYASDNTVDGVPVAKEWRGLLFKRGTDISSCFRDEHSVVSCCVLITNEKSDSTNEDYQQYIQIRNDIASGLCALRRDCCTYDPAKGGYMVFIEVDYMQKVLRETFRGQIGKIGDFLSDEP